LRRGGSGDHLRLPQFVWGCTAVAQEPQEDDHRRNKPGRFGISAYEIVRLVPVTAICAEECILLARYTDAYVATVKARFLPALDDFATEASGRAAEVYAAVMRATRDDEGHGDFETARFAAADIEQDAVDDLLFVQQQTIGSTIAGLFHFWERSMQRILFRAIRFYLPAPKPAEIERARIDQLLTALVRTGNRWPPSWVKDGLEELRLISNVVKHGYGPSLRELANRFPGRFDSVPGRAPSPDLLILEEDDLDKFGAVVSTFWRCC
jgi:hypothetical protein